MDLQIREVKNELGVTAPSVGQGGKG